MGISCSGPLWKNLCLPAIVVAFLPVGLTNVLSYEYPANPYGIFAPPGDELADPDVTMSELDALGVAWVRLNHNMTLVDPSTDADFLKLVATVSDLFDGRKAVWLTLSHRVFANSACTAETLPSCSEPPCYVLVPCTESNTGPGCESGCSELPYPDGGFPFVSPVVFRDTVRNHVQPIADLLDTAATMRPADWLIIQFENEVQPRYTGVNKAWHGDPNDLDDNHYTGLLLQGGLGVAEVDPLIPVAIAGPGYADVDWFRSCTTACDSDPDYPEDWWCDLFGEGTYDWADVHLYTNELMVEERIRRTRCLLPSATTPLATTEAGGPDNRCLGTNAVPPTKDKCPLEGPEAPLAWTTEDHCRDVSVRTEQALLGTDVVDLFFWTSLVDLGPYAQGTFSEMPLNDADPENEGADAVWRRKPAFGTFRDFVNGVPQDELSCNRQWNSVSAGLHHTCATVGSTGHPGAVYCFGANNNGRLGIGETSSKETTPVRVITDSPYTQPLAYITQVDVGDYHSCGVQSGGFVYCWGSNGSGQLGDGSAQDQSAAVIVSDVVATQVSAGALHTCSVYTGDTVSCWGKGSGGRLGNGATVNQPTAVTVTRSDTGEDLSDVIQVSAGNTHTCAVDSVGDVYCWGTNSDGQLGDGSFSAQDQAVEVLDDTTVGTRALRVTAGGDFTCALYELSVPSTAVPPVGDVWCWGRNDLGQLGQGDTVPYPSMVQVVEVAGAAVAVTAGSNGHACALLDTGSVFCWGDDAFYGKLGTGDLHGSGQPPAGVVSIADGVQAADFVLSAGSQHTCVVHDLTKLKCWGYRGWGQLGVDTNATFPECGGDPECTVTAKWCCPSPINEISFPGWDPAAP